jgi:biopolymer transport protein ExbD
MKRRSDEGVETPVASLIDVVFLLIIFFVVTASVEQDIIDETVLLAQAKYADAIEEKEKQAVVINVRKDGAYNISKIRYTPGQLKQVLAAARRDAGDNVPIIIRADGQTPYRYVSDLEEIIKQAGFWRIRLAAMAGKSGT